MNHDYFKAYCRNLQRIGLVEMIDEMRRQAEMRHWRASLVPARNALQRSHFGC